MEHKEPGHSQGYQSISWRSLQCDQRSILLSAIRRKVSIFILVSISAAAFLFGSSTPSYSRLWDSGFFKGPEVIFISVEDTGKTFLNVIPVTKSEFLDLTKSIITEQVERTTSIPVKSLSDIDYDMSSFSNYIHIVFYVHSEKVAILPIEDVHVTTVSIELRRSFSRDRPKVSKAFYAESFLTAKANKMSELHLKEEMSGYLDAAFSCPAREANGKKCNFIQTFNAWKSK